MISTYGKKDLVVKTPKKTTESKLTDAEKLGKSFLEHIQKAKNEASQKHSKGKPLTDKEKVY